MMVNKRYPDCGMTVKRLRNRFLRYFKQDGIKPLKKGEKRARERISVASFKHQARTLFKQRHSAKQDCSGKTAWTEWKRV